MTMHTLSGPSASMGFIYQSNADVMVTGTSDTVEFANSTGSTLWDHGHGLSLQLLWTVGLTVRDFEHDPTGKIVLIEGYGQHIMPTMVPDGHGGTLMTLFSPLQMRVDFAGDAHLTTASVVLAVGGH
jgi:hypothetical protein